MTFDRRTPIRLEVQKWFEEPVFFGFDYIPELQEAIRNGPFVFVDHAYFARGYKRGNFRVIRSGIHQTTLKRVSGPKTFTPNFKPWRRGSHILVFPPSLTMQETFGAHKWVEETVAEIRKHTDRKIIVKHKHTVEPLEHYLRDAHCVVGYGTVASVEAAMHGVGVVSGPHCPATPISTPIEKIEDPIYPDREAWFNSLTHSQFHVSEITSGLCKEALNVP